MKLSNEAKRNFRSRLFRYLDGLAILPIALGLEKKKLLSRILEENEITLEKLVNEDEGLHKGYVNVGLRKTKTYNRVQDNGVRRSHGHHDSVL